tara:strand:- start:49 stop:333 length:285 start_codon:yes stop_codon:yes gene_type:complete
MNELKNKNVEVTFMERFNGNTNSAPSTGFSIEWNDTPLDKWDTYLQISKSYKRESKWIPCWEEIVKSFNENTTPNEIGRIVSKYGLYRGCYLAG